MSAFEMRHGRERIIAVVDISAGAAGVAIISVPKKGPAQALASAQSPISFDEKTADQHRAAVSQHIAHAGEEALRRYAAAGHRSPVTSVYAFLHSPWSTAHTASISSEVFPSEVRITDAMIGRLAQQSIAAAQNIDRGSLYEASVVRVMLNGYQTADPVGKHAHHIEVTALMSACDPVVRAAAQSSISALFPGASLTWRSFTRAIITLFREASVFGQYLAIDMRGYATELTSYRFGILEQRTVSEGIATILRRFSQGEPEETLSTLRMLSRDACSAEQCEKIQKAMAVAEPELVRVFGEALSQLATPRRVSNEILLVTHPDVEEWLTRFFARLDFSQFTMTTLPFNVHTPASIDMSSYVAGEMPDIALQVAASLVNIELTE